MVGWEKQRRSWATERALAAQRTRASHFEEKRTSNKGKQNVAHRGGNRLQKK